MKAAAELGRAVLTGFVIGAAITALGWVVISPADGWEPARLAVLVGLILAAGLVPRPRRNTRNIPKGARGKHHERN